MTELIDFASRPQHAPGSPIDLMIAMFALGLLPLLAVTMTSFTRIIVVLGLLRASISASSLPPNSVLAALAMALTCIVMRPTFDRIRTDALAPMAARRISPSQAIDRATAPLRAFMLKQARPTDVRSFEAIAGRTSAKRGDASTSAITAAFLVGELRAAFAMGFALALPFAVIDLVVAGTLMALGMYMVAPGAIALPLKLLLFVLADGWGVVAGGLIASFR